MTCDALVFTELNTTGTGELFVRRAAQLGYEPVLITADASRYHFAGVEPEVVKADTDSHDDVVAACRHLEAEGRRIAGVMSGSDHYLVLAAAVARALGLAHNPVEALRAVRHKARQRDVLAAAGVRMAAYARAVSVEEAVRAATEIGFPVVVKPVVGSGSMGVRLCSTVDEVLTHTAGLLARETNERGQPIPAEVLVEELVRGPELSVETFGHEVVGITAKHLGARPHFVEVGHDHPAELPEHLHEAVRSAAIDAVRALGLVLGPAHVELRLAGDVPVLLEVNARLAGGMIPELVRLATGIDLVRETVRAVAGGQPDLRPGDAGHASIRFLLAPDLGTDPPDLSPLRSRPDVVDATTYPRRGLPAAGNGDFRDRVGHVIARAATADDARDAAESAVRQLRSPGDAVPAGTGRLATPVFPSVRQMLFDPRPPLRPDRLGELSRISTVDLAHVVMLAERGIVEPATAAALLRAVLDLRASGFAPLLDQPTPRGLYLAYERHLIDSVGEQVGGVLHTGRSRNDLNATCLLLNLRPALRQLAGEIVRLGHALFGRARRYRRTTMPAYTHFQPAVPITYGHYLLGIAAAVGRDLDALGHASRAMARCPLGAGAVGGTTVPIDPVRTADLLGFDAPVVNSLDAVANRDAVLRLLAAATVLGTTLDRVALDLLTWSSPEPGFLTMPDGLVGSSSMMPQKRNVFVLEHVQGKTAGPLGSFVAAAGAMRGTSYTNSISVGTEATAHVWPALEATLDAVRIIRMAVAHARPDPEALLRRADAGLTTATALSERLVAQGVPFRRAHHLLGAAASDVVAGRAASLADAAGTDPLDPADVVEQADYGAGPGPRSFDRGWDALQQQWSAGRRELDRTFAKWRSSEAALWAATCGLTGLDTQERKHTR